MVKVKARRKKMGIKNIITGEIIRVGNEEYIIAPTTHNNGSMEWEQPTLIKLKTLIKNINRQPYYKKKYGKDAPLKYMKKGFEGIKLTKSQENKNG